MKYFKATIFYSLVASLIFFGGLVGVCHAQVRIYSPITSAGQVSQTYFDCGLYTPINYVIESKNSYGNWAILADGSGGSCTNGQYNIGNPYLPNLYWSQWGGNGEWYIAFAFASADFSSCFSNQSTCWQNSEEYLHFYVANNVWSEDPLPPTSPTLTITAPTSGTTITSGTTNLTGTYAALNPSDYGGYGYLKVWFHNPNSGINSQEYTLALTTAAGSFSTPVSAFDITENGNWDLQAEQELDADTVQGLIPSPTYVLNFNITGNSTPYTFTDWNTWYLAHSAGGYSAPSDFANSIEGFFQPIFTNVYEFANQTLSYFNATTAYDKGNQIGVVFPTTQAYLDKIDVFFGGFPLIPFFEFAIIAMLGIFIIRTIFKFIPFFG